MKKLIIPAIALLLIYTGCTGSSSGNYSSTPMAATSEIAYDTADNYEYEYYEGESAASADAGGDVATASTNGMYSKMIYTYSAQIETKAYDQSLQKVADLTQAYGGFIESSNVSGKKIYGNAERTRYANYTLRIPAENMAKMEQDLSLIGNVLSLNKNADNVSAHYYDVQERIKALEKQLERMYSLMDKADKLEDVITLESSISNLIYEIESMKSQIRMYDNSVSYSTFNVSINEVYDLTTPTEKPETYGGRIAAAFVSSCAALYDIGKGAIIGLAGALPFLLIIGVIVVVALLLYRKNAAKKKENLQKLLTESKKEEE